MATAVGLEKPEKVGQEGEEQEVELDGISVTDPEEEESLVTQTLFWESTAIPVGEVNPVKFGQEDGEQEPEEAAEDVISLTELEEVSVTQTLFWESTAIPAGVNPREMRGQDEVVAQEVAPAGISMRPLEEDVVLKVVATQTLLLLSTAIVPKEEGEEAVGSEKVEEGGALPPVPPPPIPQEAREKRKKRPGRMRPNGLTLSSIKFPLDLSPSPRRSFPSLVWLQGLSPWYSKGKKEVP